METQFDDSGSDAAGYGFPPPLEYVFNLTNIAEDQQLSKRIKYTCERLLIGNKQGIPKPDVVLTALAIQPHHALITFK